MSDIVKIPSQLEPLIPLSVLALDLPAPGLDWASYLRDRGIEVTFDDVGRAAVSHEVVRQLIQERRMPKPGPASWLRFVTPSLSGNAKPTCRGAFRGGRVPVGMSAAQAMVAAGGDDGRPRTVPTAGEWMFGDYEVAGSITDAAGE